MKIPDYMAECISLSIFFTLIFQMGKAGDITSTGGLQHYTIDCLFYLITIAKYLFQMLTIETYRYRFVKQ